MGFDSMPDMTEQTIVSLHVRAVLTKDCWLHLSGSRQIRVQETIVSVLQLMLARLTCAAGISSELCLRHQTWPPRPIWHARPLVRPDCWSRGIAG